MGKLTVTLPGFSLIALLQGVTPLVSLVNALKVMNLYLAYIAEVFFRALLLIVLVFILSQLWKTTFTSRGVKTLSGFSIGLLAFWTENTDSFSLIFSRLTLVLGSVLAPLEIFPQPLRSIAQALPFSTILYGPSRTLVHFEFDRFVALLGQQVLVLAVGGLISYCDIPALSGWRNKCSRFRIYLVAKYCCLCASDL